MEKKSPLTDWHFLVGKWKGTAEGQYNMVGQITSTIEFTLELNDMCIMAKTEAWQGDQFVNSRIGLLFYDQINNRFRLSQIYSAVDKGPKGEFSRFCKSGALPEDALQYPGKD